MIASRLKVLFVLEGNTDIRFVEGLCRQFDLSLLVPSEAFQKSGLKQRIENLKLNVTVHPVAGGRLRYQWNALRWLLIHVKNYQFILAQEMLRGCLNATIAGRVASVPVGALVGIPALEYFDCRYRRRQISWPQWQVGRNVIRLLLRLNGKLLSAGFGMGRYHQNYISRFVSPSYWASYYGVNLTKFRPCTPPEKRELRKKLGLPEGAFLVLSASRISHEKDPETLLTACKNARAEGVPVHVLNLGGGFEEFLALGKKLGGADAGLWIEGRAAIHPMENLADFYRACDVLVQSSLFEGVAYCTMEALACGLPVIASNVGGMKDQLGPYALMVNPEDVNTMTRGLIGLHNQSDATQWLLRREGGLKWARETWECEKGFRQLSADFHTLAKRQLLTSGQATRQQIGQ